MIGVQTPGNSKGHWNPIFAEPLGAPHADAVLLASGVYVASYRAPSPPLRAASLLTFRNVRNG